MFIKICRIHHKNIRTFILFMEENAQKAAKVYKRGTRLEQLLFIASSVYSSIQRIIGQRHRGERHQVYE